MSARRTPDWMLERYLLGELGPEEAERISEALRANEADAFRLRELEASNRELLLQNPPEAAVAEIRRRAIRESRLEVTPRLAFAFAGAMALVGILMLPSRPPVPPAESPEIVRLKGLSARLDVFGVDGDTVRALSDGAVVRSGDVIQLAYVAAGMKQGVILSLDGKGSVTLHHPTESTGSASLVPSGAVTLDHAYRLDDAPKYERFFFITSAEPIDVEKLLRLAKVQSVSDPERLELPAGWEQSVFTLRKAEP